MDQAAVGDLELAERCGVDVDAVREWRSGASRPTKTQFAKLVARLRRPSSVYFLPEPPDADPVLRAFRGPPGSSRHRPLEDKELIALQSAERIQKIARWVRAERGDDVISLPTISSSTTLRAQADGARDHLGWRLVLQTEAKSSSEVARLLRARLEEAGILVLQFSMTPSGCRGFALHDEHAPVIAVNSAYTTEARVFTMLHEYAHIARGAGHICSRVPDSLVERRCENFAAAFLMPRDDLQRFVSHSLGVREVSSMGQVARIARHYKTSLRAAALRLVRIERAADGLYDLVDEQADFKGAGFSRDNTGAAVRLREWGAGYAELLFDAERRGLLGRTDLLEYFNLPNGQLHEVRARIEAGGVVED